MVVERREWVIDAESGQLATGGARSSTEGGSLQSMAHEPDDARVSSPDL